jgi:hypothetical protein
MKLAWHEVPGKIGRKDPSRRDRMIVCKPLNGRSMIIARRQSDICYRPVGSKSYRPYGTGRFFLTIPGTSCQATFTQSLRDTDPIATQFFDSLLGS